MKTYGEYEYKINTILDEAKNTLSEEDYQHLLDCISTECDYRFVQRHNSEKPEWYPGIQYLAKNFKDIYKRALEKNSTGRDKDTTDIVGKSETEKCSNDTSR